MGLYSVGGRHAATAATQGHCAFALWNPSSTKRLEVLEIAWCNTTTSPPHLELNRISARGTPGSTVTPDIDNAFEQDVAPPSGALLDLAAYSVQPTVEGPRFRQTDTSAAIGAGLSWLFQEGLAVPPGTGLVIRTFQALIIPVGDVSFVWAEST